MRGINIDSLFCPLCSSDGESIDHALLWCTVVTKVSQIVPKWCGVQRLFLWETQELNSQEVLAFVLAAAKEIWEAILGVSAWCIWRVRNKKVKEEKPWCLLQVTSDIQILSYLWISSRRNKPPIPWTMWMLNPLNL